MAESYQRLEGKVVRVHSSTGTVDLSLAEGSKLKLHVSSFIGGVGHQFPHVGERVVVSVTGASGMLVPVSARLCR